MAQKQNPKQQPRSAPPPKRSAIVLPAVVAIAAIAFLAWTLTRSRTPEQPAAQIQAPPPVSNPAPEAGNSQMPQIPPDVAQASEAEIAAVPRITVADLKKELDAGTAVTMDVRDIDSFGASHIPDALHIPLVYVAGELEYLPKGKKIVPYCT